MFILSHIFFKVAFSFKIIWTLLLNAKYFECLEWQNSDRIDMLNVLGSDTLTSNSNTL